MTQCRHIDSQSRKLLIQHGANSAARGLGSLTFIIELRLSIENATNAKYHN